MLSKLQQIYELRSKSGNVSGHMEVFKQLASEVDHITDFGFGGGWAASGFLIAKPKIYITYDIALQGVHNDYREMVKDDTNFIAIEADTANIEIELTDLLFIDSMHTYTHCKKELTLHGHKVSKYILLHDTVTYGPRGQDGNAPGLIQAIEEFLLNNSHWHINKIYTHCHGLTVLERDING